jgi:hypothetical protein
VARGSNIRLSSNCLFVPYLYHGLRAFMGVSLSLMVAHFPFVSFIVRTCDTPSDSLVPRFHGRILTLSVPLSLRLLLVLACCCPSSLSHICCRYLLLVLTCCSLSLVFLHADSHLSAFVLEYLLDLVAVSPVRPSCSLLAHVMHLMNHWSRAFMSAF